ncbi:MAG TPA: AraC family transcriptional regulator [Allosphingosinicella sp.]|jgi:AraC family transcriptional regulator
MTARHQSDSGFKGLAHLTTRIRNFTVSQWSQCAEPLEGEHFHREAHFIFVTSGRYETIAKGQPSDLRTQLIYNPPELAHSDRLTTGAGSFLTISISPSLSELLAEQRFPGHPLQLSHPRPQLAVRRLTKALRSCASDKLTLESYCLDLVEHCSPPGTPDRPSSPWLGKAREALSEITCPVSICELSRDVGVHPVHLVRSFKKAFGCTPGEMRSARRVSVAADLLTMSRLTLAQIAADCGYSDQSHFSNEFKRCLGFTPGHFRHLTAGQEV